MDSNAREVLGVFQSKDAVDQCIHRLRELGFVSSNIKVMVPNPEADVKQNFLKLDKQTKAPESAMTGAIVAGAVGFSLGGLLGPMQARSALVMALVLFGVGGILGGFIGWVIGRTIPEDDSKGYERSLKADEILLSIATHSLVREQLAMTTLIEMGCKNITTKSSSLPGIGSRPFGARAIRRAMAFSDVNNKNPDNNDDNEFATGFKYYSLESKFDAVQKQ